MAGKLSASVVYEDERTLAFMDIGPIIKGHTLVIPKNHYVDIHETPTALLQEVIAIAQKIARAQTLALEADGVNVVQSNGKPAGQVVPHIHFHVIPRFNDDGHSWNWAPLVYSDVDEMEQLAERIRKAVIK